MYGTIAPLIGALVTIMSGINSRFSEIAGPVVAVLIIHVVGLIAIFTISILKGDRALPGSVAPYLYLGGVIGVVTVFSSNYAFSAMGASLTVALALLGQTVFSVLADATGFLGRPKYPLSASRIPGITLAMAGVAIMGGNWRLAGIAMIVAFTAGATSGLATVINSELGRRKGVLHSVRANYVTGLTTSLVIALFAQPSIPVAIGAIGQAGPLLVLGGGLIGIVVVSSINVIMPRLSVFTFTILMFTGQTIAGVIIDAVKDGLIDYRKVAGTAVLLAGLAMDTLSGKARFKTS
ncbi:MAG: DMT family transporter [Spirochaetia bacterium]|jgi:transporter family-2 protein|nr:DMT family transporter [Spirochaetia bacterium]